MSNERFLTQLDTGSLLELKIGQFIKGDPGPPGDPGPKGDMGDVTPAAQAAAATATDASESAAASAAEVQEYINQLPALVVQQVMTYSALPAVPLGIYLVLADETKGNGPTLYFFNAGHRYWIAMVQEA